MNQNNVLLNKIEAAGREGFFVGGYVRDFLLGRPCKDVDIATSATPEEIAQIFEDTKLVGAKFGVVLVKYEGFEAEIATYRMDGCYSDSRRPDSVAFTTDVTEDVIGRDFTVNALLMDTYGIVHDVAAPYVGKQDLCEKLIRCVGDPTHRFVEDGLRMLRAVRFAAQLDFDIEPVTFAAIQDMAHTITRISEERITQELVKILTSGRARRGMELLEFSGLMRHILPEINALRYCPQNPKHHPEGDVLIHTYRLLEQLPAGVSLTLALAALFHDVGKPATLDYKDGQPTAFGHDQVGADIAEKILRRMKLPNDVIDTVVVLIQEHMRFRVIDEMCQSKLYRFLRQPNFMELLELHRMDAMAGRGNLTHYNLCVQKLAEVPEEVLRPVKLITGADLIEMGLKPGPLFKEILIAVENQQLEGTVTTTQEALDAAYRLCWHINGVKADPTFKARFKEKA